MRRFVTIACLFLVLGCSSADPEPPEPPDVPIVDDEMPVMPPLYTLRVSRDAAGALSIDDVTYTAGIEGQHRPLAPAFADRVAVAYSGGAVVDAVPFTFPTEYIAEDVAEDGTIGDPETGVLDAVAVRVHLDATEPIDRIDVVDSSMTVLATVSDLPSASALGYRPFASHPWIELLTAEDMHPIIDEASGGAGITSLTPAEVEDLAAALDALPPRLASSIDTLGVAPLSRPGLAYGGHVFLDDGVRGYVPGRRLLLLLHEAGHAYHAVSIVEGGGSFDEWASDWPADVVAAVRRTHEQLGIDRDLTGFWTQLQQAAIEAGVSVPYAEGIASPRLSGFVTGYAGTKLGDDIADTVMVANFKAIQDLSPEFSSSTCLSYQLADELTMLTALAYLKIRLVGEMGLASEENVDWCLGDAAPTMVDGIQLGEALFFERELRAGYTGADREQFNIVGQDPEGRGMAIELATEGRHPIGVYPLDVTWWGAWDGSNTLVIASPNAAEARTASAGVVVITYADSSDRVDGFVFNLHLRSALGPASSFPFVPFRIPL